jgi:hypothetical protein
VHVPGVERDRVELALGAPQGLGVAGAFLVFVVQILLAAAADLVWVGGQFREGDSADPGACSNRNTQDEVGDESAVALAQVAAEEKAKIVYVYDFGDDWRHDIVVEKITPALPGVAYPRCTGPRAESVLIPRPGLVGDAEQFCLVELAIGGDREPLDCPHLRGDQIGRQALLELLADAERIAGLGRSRGGVSVGNGFT